MASKYPSFFNLCDKWTEFLYSEEVENILVPILNELEEEKKYYPEDKDIFRCFYMTPFDNVKVVILGTGPYDNGSATGLCFDVKLGKPLNPSLQNIYKELEFEGFYPVKDGNLESWTRQGVLLLNTSLTIKEGEPESHIELWSDFSDKVIRKLSEKDFIVWVILGNKDKYSITNKNHIILEVSHPSLKSFIGSGIFKNVNKELSKNNLDKISW